MINKAVGCVCRSVCVCMCGSEGVKEEEIRRGEAEETEGREERKTGQKQEERSQTTHTS